jgi:hypothetical protein
MPPTLVAEVVGADGWASLLLQRGRTRLAAVSAQGRGAAWSRGTGRKGGRDELRAPGRTHEAGAGGRHVRRGNVQHRHALPLVHGARAPRAGRTARDARAGGRAPDLHARPAREPAHAPSGRGLNGRPGGGHQQGQQRQRTVVAWRAVPRTRDSPAQGPGGSRHEALGSQSHDTAGDAQQSSSDGEERPREAGARYEASLL